MSLVAETSQPLIETVLPPPAHPQLWRMSVDQYHEMARRGILTEEHEVELLDGIVVAKMTKSTAHNVAKLLVQNALARVVPDGWFVDTQDAITLSTSEPEPDVMVIRGEPRDYLSHHPQPGEIALVVEVSDTSLRYDRGPKKIVYAADTVPVYWIVNLVDARLEVYTEPTGADESPDFRRRREFREAEEVPVIIPGREVGRIPARELLP